MCQNLTSRLGSAGKHRNGHKYMHYIHSKNSRVERRSLLVYVWYNVLSQRCSVLWTLFPFVFVLKPGEFSWYLNEVLFKPHQWKWVASVQCSLQVSVQGIFRLKGHENNRKDDSRQFFYRYLLKNHLYINTIFNDKIRVVSTVRAPLEFV